MRWPQSYRAFWELGNGSLVMVPTSRHGLYNPLSESLCGELSAAYRDSQEHKVCLSFSTKNAIKI